MSTYSMLHKQDAQNTSHAATSSRTVDADGKERNLTSKVVTIYTYIPAQFTMHYKCIYILVLQLLSNNCL